MTQDGAEFALLVIVLFPGLDGVIRLSVPPCDVA